MGDYHLDIYVQGVKSKELHAVLCECAEEEVICGDDFGDSWDPKGGASSFYGDFSFCEPETEYMVQMTELLRKAAGSDAAGLTITLNLSPLDLPTPTTSYIFNPGAKKPKIEED